MKQSEKGSVTMIVVVTIFFIVILLSSFFIYTTSRRRAQLEETKRISNAYDGDMETIYEDINIRYEERGFFKYYSETNGITIDRVEDLEKEDIKELIIPSEYSGQPVTTILANGFKGCSSLESITIPKSVQTIEDDAFADWTSSQTIYIEGKISEKDFISLGKNCFGNAKVIFEYDNDQNTNEITDRANLNSKNENTIENETANKTNLENNI